MGEEGFIDRNAKGSRVHFYARFFPCLQKDRLARTMSAGLRAFSGSVRDTPGPITKNNVPEDFSAPLKEGGPSRRHRKGLFSRGWWEIPVLWKRRCAAASREGQARDHSVGFDDMVLRM